MSFKTTSEKTKKVNVSDDMNAYMREYRAKHHAHFLNVERCKYYKKRGLSQEVIDNFGEHSGDVFKLINVYAKVKGKITEEQFELLKKELAK